MSTVRQLLSQVAALAALAQAEQETDPEERHYKLENIRNGQGTPYLHRTDPKAYGMTLRRRGKFKGYMR